MKNKVLGMLRFALGVLNLAALVCVFVIPPDPIDPSAGLPEWLAHLAKLQFGPAVLALDVVALVVVLALTFAFGRFYCEVICPLGVSQDVLRKACFFLKRQGVRRVCCRLPVTRPQLAVRTAILVVACAVTACGIVGYAWVDPYAIFGRAMTRVEVVTFAAVLVLVFVGKGRIWCNWICPVGTVFAGLARFSWGRKKTTFDSHCKDCRACWPAERK